MRLVEAVPEIKRREKILDKYLRTFAWPPRLFRRNDMHFFFECKYPSKSPSEGHCIVSFYPESEDNAALDVDKSLVKEIENDSENLEKWLEAVEVLRAMDACKSRMLQAWMEKDASWEEMELMLACAGEDLKP